MPSVVRIAATIRALVVLATVLFDVIVDDYDESDAASPCMLQHLAHWDGVYFREVAVEGGYRYLHFNAFQPMAAVLFRVAGMVYRAALNVVFGTVTEVGKCDVVTAGVVVNNVLCVLSAVLLERIAVQLGAKSRAVGVAFALSPVGVFLSALYSEPLFCFLSFAFILCVMQENGGLRGVVYMSLIGSLLTMTRANGILAGGYCVWLALRKRDVAHLIPLLCMVGVFWSWQNAVWGRFCGEDVSLCGGVGALGLYSHIQEEYWGVGLLRYFTLKQAPNFGLAMPMVWVAFRALHSSLGNGRWRALGSLCTQGAFVEDLQVVMAVHLAVLLAVGVLVSHVQILPRLLAASPLIYTELGSMLHQKQSRGLRVNTATYLVAWQLVGAVLFSNFYPWT